MKKPVVVQAWIGEAEFAVLFNDDSLLVKDQTNMALIDTCQNITQWYKEALSGPHYEAYCRFNVREAVTLEHNRHNNITYRDKYLKLTEAMLDAIFIVTTHLPLSDTAIAAAGELRLLLVPEAIPNT